MPFERSVGEGLLAADAKSIFISDILEGCPCLVYTQYVGAVIFDLVEGEDHEQTLPQYVLGYLLDVLLQSSSVAEA